MPRPPRLRPFGRVRALAWVPCAAPLLLLLLLVAPLLAAPVGARAQHVLASGDAIEVLVFRVPELDRRATVDLDGAVAFPPLGRLPAAGATLEEFAARIRDGLAAQQILSDAQVTVALVAARPVFVGGDVAEPGSYPYQAGLTARRAIALAGGVGIARETRLEEMAALRGERAGVAAELLRDQARAARLAAALEGRDAFEAPVPPPGVDLAGPRRAEIVALERARLVSEAAEAAAEKAHLARGAELAQERIDTLLARQKLQQGLMDAQSREIDRIREIQDRGLASQSRVVDERRAFEAMQERAADTAAELSAARREREDLAHAIARFDDRRRAALEAERQAALLGVESATTRLRATEDRLVQLGAADLGALAVTLYRTEDGREVATPADPDTPLRPGDMIEVTLALPDAAATVAPDGGEGAGAAEGSGAEGAGEPAGTAPADAAPQVAPEAAAPEGVGAAPEAAPAPGAVPETAPAGAPAEATP